MTGRQRRGGGESGGSLSSSSTGGPSFFYEDEVVRINKQGKIEFGMVTENWDMYSSDEDEEEEEMDHQDKVPVGHVAVTWLPKSKDEVIPEHKVELSDRSLMPGDVVRRLIAGKDTQRGYCRTVRVMADVQRLGTNKVITGVPAISLLPVQKIQPDIAVYMDSWIGVVRDVKYKVKLKFVEGSTCVVDSDILIDNFEEVRNNVDYLASEVFFPGQHLRGKMKHLKDAVFSYATEDLKRAKEKKAVNVIVVDVQPLSVHVQWQWQTPTAPSSEDNKGFLFKPPPEHVLGDDIKRIKCLNLFESCTVQISDVSYYAPSAKDMAMAMDKEGWTRYILDSLEEKKLGIHHPKPAEIEKTGVDDSDGPEDGFDANKKTNTATANNESSNKITGKKLLPKVSTRSLRKKKLKRAPKKPVLPKMECDAVSVVETLHTESYVDIVWQDGTYEEGMRSTELYPIHHLDDHEFFPGDFVVMADSNDLRKYGVIQKMDHCGRVAMVKWFETYSFNGEQKPKLLEETEMSVYDIKDHPDFRFRPGTIVIRVANWLNDQCPAGQILDNYPDGQVRVWWADGATSDCWPQDLFRLGEYDSDEGEIWDDHEHDMRMKAELSDTDDAVDDDDASTNSDDSWETESSDDEASDSASRYRNIGQLIDRIQTTLVSTREAIVASSNVTVAESSNSSGAPLTPISKLASFDERGLTKKLLLIYKDCQYLDKIMGTKFFDVDDLKKLKESSTIDGAGSKARKIVEQISRLFDAPSLSMRSVKNAALAPGLEESQSDTSLPRDGDTDESSAALSESQHAAGMVLYDLCSIILKKLVQAHKQYEERFGKWKQAEVDTEENKATVDAEENKCHQAAVDTEENNRSVDRADQPQPVNLIKGLIGRILDEAKRKERGETSGQAEDTSATDLQILELKEAIESGMLCVPSTIEPQPSNLKFSSTNFTMVEKVPDTHRYRLTSFLPQNQRIFVKTVQKEGALLRESLPEGIYVKGFEDRMDLYSVMIEGPEKTPYEDGLFMFDIQLPPAYPSVPPSVHYISFCTDRLNPNLYEEGKVCVSLLGTWNGKGTEVWTSSSSLLQLLVSIQGLILNPEPYYNEAGYEKQKGSQQGAENARMYNENVLIKLVQSMSRMVANPPLAWQIESLHFIKTHGPRMVERYKRWLEVTPESSKDDEDRPAFPLLPVSKGFHITLSKSISSFAKLLSSL